MTEMLASYTTLRLGGPAGELLTHATADDWTGLTRAARRHRLPPLIIGGGSNVIAADHGYPGPVIRIATRGVEARPADGRHVDLLVQAGEPLDAVVSFAAAHGLSGIEYLAGIPGTAGAAPVQNTGAYGQQISDTLTTVTAYDWHEHKVVTIPASACHLTHRSSSFKASTRWTILAITLRLQRSAMAAAVTYSRSPTPWTCPSAAGLASRTRWQPYEPTARPGA